VCRRDAARLAWWGCQRVRDGGSSAWCGRARCRTISFSSSGPRRRGVRTASPTSLVTRCGLDVCTRSPIATARGKCSSVSRCSPRARRHTGRGAGSLRPGAGVSGGTSRGVAGGGVRGAPHWREPRPLRRPARGRAADEDLEPLAAIRGAAERLVAAAGDLKPNPAYSGGIDRSSPEPSRPSEPRTPGWSRPSTRSSSTGWRRVTPRTRKRLSSVWTSWVTRTGRMTRGTTGRC
jgi:hypothetical protein